MASLKLDVTERTAPEELAARAGVALGGHGLVLAAIALVPFHLRPVAQRTEVEQRTPTFEITQRMARMESRFRRALFILLATFPRRGQKFAFRSYLVIFTRDKSGHSGHRASSGFRLSRLFRGHSGQSGQTCVMKSQDALNGKIRAGFNPLAAHSSAQNSPAVLKLMNDQRGELRGAASHAASHDNAPQGDFAHD